ncbi:MAG TPA: TonB-dependent siderophore receptor [Gemmatimonadaceae bacterium]
MPAPTAARDPGVPTAAADTSRRRPAARDTVAHLDAVHSRAGRQGRSGYGVQRTATAAKIDLPLLNTPQAVSVVSRAVIADQGMQSMADVARYLPGVSFGAGEGHRDAPTIRGNASTADFFVDGVRDDAQYLRDLYNVERVEALKGANAMTFGRGGGGGVLNRVTKQAEWNDVRGFTAEGGSFDHRRATIDLGSSAGLIAGRFNGMAERSGLTRGTGTLSRHAFNPTGAIVLGGTTLRAGYEYAADRRTVDRGIPSYLGRPLDAAPDAFFGDPDASHAFSIVSAGAATIERGDAGGVRLRNATRLASYDKFYQNVFPRSVNAAGTEVTLAGYNHAIQRHNAFNQTDLTWAAGQGAFRQTLLVGAEVGRQNTEQVRHTGYFGSGAAPTATSMTVPVSEGRVTAPVQWRQSATDGDTRAIGHVAAAYVQEHVELGAHVQAIAGLRFDRFALDFENRRTGERLSRTDRMVSPRAGLVVKPVRALSLYGTYSVSALPSSGDQFTTLSVSTTALEPERFTNREAGVKWEPLRTLTLQAAAYQLERSNTTAPDPVDPSLVVQTGRQRTTGFELDASGSITSRWQLAAGFASQSATVVSRTKAAREGATVPLVPRTTLSLWNRVQVAGPLALGAGVVHQARMYAAIDNKVTLPGFTRYDAAAFLALGRGLTAQVNVENLLDTRYIATSHGNDNIMPGARRAVRISLSARP